MIYTLDACNDGYIVKCDHERHLFTSFDGAKEFIKATELQKVFGNFSKEKVIRFIHIADLHKKGHIQKEIAKELNLSQSTISNDMWTIRMYYPELLIEK